MYYWLLLVLCDHSFFLRHRTYATLSFATQRCDFCKSAKWKLPNKSVILIFLSSFCIILIMPLVRISWPHGCKHLAMLAGSWSQWHPQVLMPTKLDNLTEIWSTHVKLPDNVDHAIYRFKFIVDGEWVFDPDQPHLVNEYGSYDNYIVEVVTRCKLGQLLRKLVLPLLGLTDFSHSFALWLPSLLLLLRICGFLLRRSYFDEDSSWIQVGNLKAEHLKIMASAEEVST